MMDLYTKLPFTYAWIIKRHIGKSKKLLDIGCGDGSFMAQINADKAYGVIGTELFGPYIKKAQKTGAYKEILKKDIRILKFPKKSFDITLSSQVIEHLTKKEGNQLMKAMEAIARKKVIIGTPHGHFHQEGYDHNHLQEHKSAWEIADFTSSGYHVYGQGLRWVYAEGSLGERYKDNKTVLFALYLFSYVMSPLVYLFPSLGAHLIAVKEK